MRERFALTWHGAVYRLVLGGIVIAIVIPPDVGGHQPLWPFALLAIAVVVLGVFAAHHPRVRAWLRRR